MMARLALRAVCGALFVAALAGCGQRGPLVLPSDARPIERLEQPTETDETPEDERENER